MRRLLAGLAVATAAVAAGEDADLLYHAETADGRVVATRDADEPFNPASVVKVATSLEALDRLGRDHRWETALCLHGSGRQDLLVVGGGDPDLQPENVMLLARELESLGVRRVGTLAVSGELAVGWEHGMEGRSPDPAARASEMGRRFRDALDPDRWNRSLWASWRGLAARRGWSPTVPPRVRVEGPVVRSQGSCSQPLLRHLSAPLPVVLRRLNVYSNNDIVRVAQEPDGAGVERWLAARLAVAPERVALSTASGEGVNRLTPRLVVGLMRAAREQVAASGLELADLLAVSGCDPGPLASGFPRLVGGAVVAKTGTLVRTDGGVAVLAGVVATRDAGPLLFCVAAPRTGGRTRVYREREERWLVELAQAHGGMVGGGCGAPLPFSDELARVVAPPGGG